MLTRGQTALLAGFTALAPLAIDMYLPAMPPLAADLGVSMDQASQSLSVFLFGLAGGQLVSGPLSDRLGRRPVAIAGLALFVAAGALAAVTTSFAVLLAARLLQALGACSAMVAARAIVRDRLDATESARFFSLLALIGGLAPVLAPLIGAGLLLVGDWRLIFWVMAGFAAVLFAAGMAALPETRSAETAANARAEQPFAAYWALLTNRALLGYLLAAMFNTASFFAYIANSSVVFVGGYGLTPAAFSLLFGLNSVALVGAGQINRSLLKNRTPDALLALSARNGLVLAALFLLFAGTQAGGMWAINVLFFFLAGSVSPIQANTMGGGLAIDPLRAGSAAALFGAMTFAGGAAASAIGGLLYDGTPRGLAIVIACCLIGCAASIRLIVLRRPEAAE
ncbi:multidrug effflux MFS transporter [Sphingomonas canadensis]|uniref:Bcr/CflA family efflux transporter n=1 Tax=Sphingomonas canadensis TaxID=1219257 RepID=A0ABW3HAY4_9SPHN|nr:multidrug effflux MFS transporter [Sphingomonas canadensis]MCW3838313.1 multidrug effflux MFS transporter [Sphingomonas canadensis]